jgi:hypothetical protein
MMRTGEVGEIDTRGVGWSGGRAPVTECYDLAVVCHEQARVCPVNGDSMRSGRVHRCRLHRRERKCRCGAGGVSSTLPGADVRGFYRALGFELPGGLRASRRRGVSRIWMLTRTVTATRPAR